jgi:hypothetical protein
MGKRARAHVWETRFTGARCFEMLILLFIEDLFNNESTTSSEFLSIFHDALHTRSTYEALLALIESSHNTHSTQLCSIAIDVDNEFTKSIRHTNVDKCMQLCEKIIGDKPTVCSGLRLFVPLYF